MARNRAARYTSSMAEIPPDRLSLVVGVTGHRDIAADDETPLRAAFGRILEQLAETCPHTPLLVLSGLAAGADSLAAEEAIARDIPVIACLPMPIPEYEKDFSQPELERFRSLLAACSRTIVTSPAREDGYVATGRFIAQYSHLLVALWDGEASRGAGGTYDVIEMRMTGLPGSAVEDIPYLPDVGPVDLIVTPRISGPRPAKPYSVRRLYPRRFAHDRTVAQNFGTILARIDEYNVDLARVPALSEKPPLEAFVHRTDEVANRLQRETGYFQITLFVIAFLAAAIQVIGHIPPLAKVVGLGAAFLFYGIARRHDYENRYQDYRAVAEGLRVQSAWYYAGLRYRLVDNAYLRMQEGDLQWIRMALRSFYLLYCEGREAPDASHDNPACREWVRSQWRYYYRASRREAGRKHLLDRISMVAIAIGIVCFIGSAIVLGKNFHCAIVASSCPEGVASSRRFELLQNLLTVPIVLAAMLGAIFTHYSEKQNLLGSARRYERMFRVFDRARRELSGIAKGNPEKSREVIYELGRAALIEHADWLIMRRDRPMKVVMV
jgi:hypothetical protein